jgi:hypothetical protein
MYRYRELLDAERTVVCEMVHGAVGGRYTYWRRKGEVNLKLCSQCETIFYECLYRTATPLWNLQFYYCLWRQAISHTHPLHERIGSSVCC